jgi:Tol biopolymer transport system component
VVESFNSILNRIIKYRHSYVAIMMLLCLTLASYALVSQRHYNYENTAIEKTFLNLNTQMMTQVSKFSTLDKTALSDIDSFPSGEQKICFSRGEYIYLFDSRTKAIRRIAKGYNPNLSPDGKLIAFTQRINGAPSYERTMKVIDLKTNGIRSYDSLDRLPLSRPIWSPDGAKLAFSFVDNEYVQIGVLDSASGNWYVLPVNTTDHRGVYLASWTQDNKSIVCHDSYNIYEIALTGDLLQTIPIEKIVEPGAIASPTRFSFSNDRRYLLFDTIGDSPEINTIYIFDFQQQVLSRVTPETISGSEPRWLPSGKAILFDRFIANESSKPLFSVSKISLDGNNLVTITPNAQNASYSTK